MAAHTRRRPPRLWRRIVRHELTPIAAVLLGLYVATGVLVVVL